ncbi:hypothetical protein DY000_02050699 [Brassica cretica]|uniref:Uncharacterized protein n=1 Tax=Brassica cretica TaxID=69181 RepID=A0ABQ7F7L4_BRACR|nr:hypothetical protein DY000_02050699 [Brassica cretica]
MRLTVDDGGMRVRVTSSRFTVTSLTKRGDSSGALQRTRAQLKGLEIKKEILWEIKEAWMEEAAALRGRR